MDHARVSTVSGGIPLIDTSEKTRLNYWRQYSEPIPRELLEITGWISPASDRVVVAEIAGQAVPARGADAPNVLFRLPTDPAGRRQWESYLHFLRLRQARTRMVQGIVDSERSRLKQLNGALESLWDELFEHDELARDRLGRARAATDPKERASWIADARVQLEEARRVATEFHATSRRVRIAERAVARHQQLAGPITYPGIYAEINSFLDMQCLTTASLASDQFRRNAEASRPRDSIDPFEAVIRGDV